MRLEPKVDATGLRRLRRFHYLVFASAGLSVILWIGGGVLAFLLPDYVGRLAGIISAAGFGILLITIFVSVFFKRARCPRCGKPFYTSETTVGFLQKINYLTTRCGHCGQSMMREQQDRESSGHTD
jgi:ribosomal protein S27AE